MRGKDPKLAKPSRPKVVVFGPAGVGKTWTALDFPDCYYIDCEGGASLDHYTDKLKKVGALYVGPEDGANDFSVVNDEVHWLATHKHDRKTLIIDSFTKLYNTAIQNEHDRLIADGKKVEFAVDKKPAIAMTRKLIAKLDSLDMNVILICHEKAKWKNGESIGETFDGFEKLEYELNLVLQVYRRGGDRKARIKKSRFEKFNEADSIDWSYEEFATRFGRETMEANSVTVDLASDEQVKQIKELIDVLHVEKKDVIKVLNSAGVDRWDDMPSDRIEAAITKLQKKLEKVGA